MPQRVGSPSYREVPVSITVPVKVYDCVNADGPFYRQIGFGTHPINPCKFDGNCNWDGNGACKRSLKGNILPGRQIIVSTRKKHIVWFISKITVLSSGRMSPSKETLLLIVRRHRHYTVWFHDITYWYSVGEYWRIQYEEFPYHQGRFNLYFVPITYVRNPKNHRISAMINSPHVASRGRATPILVKSLYEKATSYKSMISLCVQCSQNRKGRSGKCCVICQIHYKNF